MSDTVHADKALRCRSDSSLESSPVPSGKCVRNELFTYFSHGHPPSDDGESRETIEIGHSNRQTYHIDPGSAPDEAMKYAIGIRPYVYAFSAALTER